MALTDYTTIDGGGNLVTSVASLGLVGFIAGSDGLQKGKHILEKKVRENISHTCHDLKKLADMGHPYSVLHPNNPHPEKPYLIHKQTGNLLSAVRSGTSPMEIWVGINEDVAPYARCLIEGTPRMIRRDFLSGSRDEVKDGVAGAFRSSLGKIVLGAAMLYQVAHFMKWASKFVGASPWVSKAYKAARYARTAEVIGRGNPYGLSRRFINVTMMGRVAQAWQIPGGGPTHLGGAVVNKYVMQAYGSRLFKAF